MQKMVILLVLAGLTWFCIPPSFSQQKHAAFQESPAQEQREEQREEQQEHKRQANRDVPAEMQRAREGLETAKSELERAGDEWGGHRVAAIHHIDQALEEIRKSEEYAKQHKLMK